MKKIIAMLLVLLLALAAVAVAEVKSVPALGLELDIPKSDGTANYTLSEISLEGVMGVNISYYNMAVMMPIGEEMQNAVMENDEAKAVELQQKMAEAAALHMATYYNIIGIETSAIEAVWEAYGLADREIVEIGSNSTHTYYLLTGVENENMPEEDKALMEAERPTIDAIVASVKIIEIEEEKAISAFPAFETVDMNGNTVTEDIFAQAELTILNVWGTFCNPCIAEMPELAAWANELPEGVQIVGLISDVKSTTDKNFAKAEKILSKSGATFINILNNDSLNPLMETVSGTPTTFFIDRNGNSVHEPVVGALMNQYKAAVAEILG